MERFEIGVAGLRCEKCSAAVARALCALPGVENVEVTLEPMRAALDFDPGLVGVEELRAAIIDEEKGFSVV